MRRFYIYAGTHEQARTLANLMELQPQEWSYVIDVGTLMGLRNKVILCYGTVWDRDDVDRFMEMVKTREHKLLYIK